MLKGGFPILVESGWVAGKGAIGFSCYCTERSLNAAEGPLITAWWAFSLRAITLGFSALIVHFGNRVHGPIICFFHEDALKISIIREELYFLNDGAKCFIEFEAPNAIADFLLFLFGV